jgi:hypothetical protein
MHHIYHIVGVKIGCSTQPARRVKEQGYDDYTILESHEDIYVASAREIELQMQYGYPVDKIPYYQSRANRHELTFEDRSRGGKKVGAQNKLKGHLLTAPKSPGGLKTGNMIRNCPHCDRPLKGPGAYNSHTKNCKYGNQD